MKEAYKSRVYVDRPAYADYDPPRKFEAIQSIVARRLREHPNAICSYSGGSDSDIMAVKIDKDLVLSGLRYLGRVPQKADLIAQMRELYEEVRICLS